jgi:hypothetical protein
MRQAKRAPANAGAYQQFALVSRLRSGWSRLLLAMTAVMTHLAELLHLFWSEYPGELRLHALVDGAELLAALLRRQRGIGAQSGDLLLAIGEDGLELRGLVGRETEPLANSLRGAMRIGCVVVPVVTLLRRCVRRRWGRLSQRQSACQGQGKRGGEEKMLHGSCSLSRPVRARFLRE